MLKMYEEDSPKREKKKKKVYEGNFKFPKLRSWPTKIRKEKRRKKKEKKRAILKNVIFINKYFNIRSCFNFSTTLSKDLSIKITVISWILRAKVGIKNGKVSSYYYDGNYTFFFFCICFCLSHFPSMLQIIICYHLGN